MKHRSEKSTYFFMLKEVVRRFAFAWFLVNMVFSACRMFETQGTGIVSILFHSYPYGNDSETMKIFSMIFFFLNLVLFVLFTAMTIARFILFPETLRSLIPHPLHGLYFSTFPLAATTLISGAVSILYSTFGFGGKGFLYTVWAIWWVDVAVSCLCCWGLLHIAMTRQDQRLDAMTTAWLLPVVPLIVTSSSGGILSPALQEFSPSYALVTLVFTSFMLTIGLLFSMMILTIYLLRLISHNYPPGLTVLSTFFPLAATAVGGYSVLLVGQAFNSLLPLQYGTSVILQSSTTGDIIFVMCTIVSFMLWAFGTAWMLSALLAVQEVWRQSPLPFKLTFWSIIFPNGLYANLSIQLGRTFDSDFFQVWGAIYAALTLLLWICASVKTVMLVPSGIIFDMPGLPELRTVLNAQHENEPEPEKV